MQAEVEKILDAEKVQSRLTEENAGFGQGLWELKNRRKEAAVQFGLLRAELQAKRHKPAEKLKTTQNHLENLRKEVPQAAARIPELDRELREVQQLYSKALGTELHTAQSRDDLIRLRDRTIFIPNQKADLIVRDARIVSKVKELEAQVITETEVVSELDTCLRVLESTFEESDRQLAAEIKTQEGERKRIDQESESLEQKKATPYGRIGACLADCGIAPVNRPHILEAVVNCRLELAESLDALERSLKRSAQDPFVVPAIYYVVAGIGMVMGIVLLFRF